MTIDGSGSLAPNDEVALAFPSGGRVAEVLVAVGDRVAAGDALARLDDTDAVQTVAEAELQVRQNEINLALVQLEAESGMSQGQPRSSPSRLRSRARHQQRAHGRPH